MIPMKISGSQVSMKLVTSSKKELPSYFVVVTGGCVSPGVALSPLLGCATALPCGWPPCAQSLTFALTQGGSGGGGEVTAAMAATIVARAIATRRRRTGAVIQGANRQGWARALP